jgi:hypothetical protein
VLAQSNLFSVALQATAPAWFTALPYGEWVLLSSAQSMQSVSSGVAARTLTMPWIGAAVDQSGKKFVIANPGGHNDGGSNAVYEFRLGDATPNWYRTRVGTGVGMTDAANSVGVDGTGQPSNTHSYHRPLVANGRFWLPGLDSAATSNGYWTTTTVSYDLSQTANGVWRSHGRMTLGAIPKWLGGSAAYDSINDRIFSFPQQTDSGSGFYFNVSNVLAAADTINGAVPGATAIAMPSFGSWVFSASVFSASLARLFMAFEDSDTSAFAGIRSLQVNNLGAGWTSHTISGTTPFPVYSGGGFVRHESANRFYSHNSGGNAIRVLDVPNPVTGTWTGRSVTLGGATAPGTSSDNGSRGFSRFNIVQDMGNGEPCLLWYPTHTLAGMYVCRVPAAGL